MNKKQLLVLLVILTTGFLCVNGQVKKIDLKDQRITIQMVEKPLFSVFARLMYKFDVPIGFEESGLDKNHNDYDFQTNVPPDEEKSHYADKILVSDIGPKVKDHLITINFVDARFEDVMNAIVKQMKNYDWKIHNDAVNIFPISVRDSKFEKLLDMKVCEFNLQKGTKVGFLQFVIYGLPEFKSYLLENNLTVGSERWFSLWFDERPLPSDMKFSNLTFRELLNEITRLKRGGWILRKSKSSKIKDKEAIELLI
jgi:hypothetical protein